MSNNNTRYGTDPFTRKLADPKMLGVAGGMLFVLGLFSVIVGFYSGKEFDGISRVAGGAVLLAFGYPLLLYVGSLKRFGEQIGRAHV